MRRNLSLTQSAQSVRVDLPAHSEVPHGSQAAHLVIRKSGSSGGRRDGLYATSSGGGSGNTRDSGPSLLASRHLFEQSQRPMG